MRNAKIGFLQFGEIDVRMALEHCLDCGEVLGRRLLGKNLPAE
jgi:hypothetical protein